MEGDGEGCGDTVRGAGAELAVSLLLTHVRHLPRPNHERDMGLFISTLRKYPTAERSPSTELLERLIKSAPYSPKDSPADRSKSPVSVGDKNRAAKEPSRQTAKSKKDTPRSPNKAQKINLHLERHETTPTRDKDPVPKRTVSITAFDYMKSALARSSPGAPAPDRGAGPSEPRTLRKMYREIYRNRPLAAYPLCPTIQSRYEHHKKHCHPSTSQVPHIDITQLERCNKCLLTRPCPCETVKMLRRIVDMEEDDKQNIENAIFSWLKDIPVYPNENPHDKFIRDAIVKKLAETLSGLDDDQFTISAREEINKAIEKLPMWYPRDERDRAIFKSNIIDNLLDKIKSARAEKTARKATENFLNQINFYNDKDINRMQAVDDFINEWKKIQSNKPDDDDVYRSMLKMKAFDMMDRLPVKTNLNRYDYLNQLSDELADTLIGLSSKPLDAKKKQDLTEGIAHILDETNDHIRNRDKVEENLRDAISDIVSQNMDRDKAETYIKTMLKGRVADAKVEEITNNLLKLVDTTQDIIRIGPILQETIRNDISDILDQTKGPIKNRDKIEENLRNAISDVVSQNMDRDKAERYIKTMLKGKVADAEVEEMTKKLLELADTAQDTLSSRIDPQLQETIRNDISDILDQTKGPIKNRGKIEENLRDAISNVVSQNMDKDKAESYIKTMLKGKVADTEVEKMTKKLLELADTAQDTLSHTSRIDPQLQETIKNDVSDILDQTKGHIKNRGKLEENIRDAISNVVSQNMDRDKAKSYIKTMLKGKVADTEVEKITKKLLELADTAQDTLSNTSRIDPQLQETIRNDISDILDQTKGPIKNRGKIEENLRDAISNVVSQNMDRDKAERYIKTMLKGKVADTEVEKMTRKLLKLADTAQDTLSNTSRIDPQLQETIRNDISDILDQTKGHIKNRDKVEENLRDAVSNVVSQNMDRDKAKSYIKTMLKGKVADTEVEKITKKLLELADTAQDTLSITSRIDPQLQETIRNDISDILDQTKGPIKNRGKIEENLRDAISNVVSQNMDRDKAERYIKTMLKGKVADTEVEKMTKKLLELADTAQDTLSNSSRIDPQLQETIRNDISDILDQTKGHIKNRGKVEENLRDAISNVVSQNMDRDKAERYIKTMLEGKVADTEVEKMTKKLLELADTAQDTLSNSSRIDPQLQETIRNDISDILDQTKGHIKNRGKVEENLRDAISNVVSQNMDRDKAERYIKTMLEGKVADTEVEEMTKKLLELADTAQDTLSNTSGIDPKLQETIRNDVSDILDLSKGHIRNRRKVEESLRNAISDVVSQNMDRNKAETYIKTMLKGKVADTEVDEITKKLLAVADSIQGITRIGPKLLETIRNNISDILDQTKSYIRNRGKVEETLRDAISNVVSQNMDRDKAESYLKSVLKGKVAERDVKEITNKLLELADTAQDTLSNTLRLDPKLQETIRTDISDILDQTKGHIKNRSQVEESLGDLLSDIVMRGMDTSKAHDYIHGILKGNVSDSQVADISRKILALANEMSFRFDTGGPSASSTQNADKMHFDQVYETVREWLSNHVTGLDKNKFNEVAQAIANDIIDRQKYLQLNTTVKSSPAKELEILKEQVYKALNKLIGKKSVQSIMPQVEALMRSLKEIPIPQDSKDFVQENLEGALLDWLRGSPIYRDRNEKNRQTQEQMMTKLAASLTAILTSQASETLGVKADAILLKEITKHLEGMPIEPQFKSKEYIRKLADHMLDYLKSLQLFQDISDRISMKDSQRWTSFMPSTNHLNDTVRNWCQALPLPDTDESFQIKQDLANKIILKIGELNMNPDIFNDDNLYEEMMQDFIEQELNALQLDLNISEASKNLIGQIKEIKQRFQDTLVGRAYRQQLRATISNTLPSMACPTEEVLASFELLKEHLADAFINLNYSIDDEAARAKLRRRITDEIDKFANEYLGRCPATPVCKKMLQKALHTALNNVPPPDDDSMRSEVEAVRMKDLIYDWLNILPLTKQTKAEQLHTYKVVSLMAQELQELETEFDPEFSEIATEKIVTYLKKLPLRTRNNLDVMAKKLIDKITNTTESRSFIAGARSARTSDCCSIRNPPLPCPGYTDISPCGLSKEGKKRLQQIRDRACQAAPPCLKPFCQDAAVNPLPSDHGSQTVMETRPSKSSQCADKFEPICPINRRPCTSAGIQADYSPCVLVKEYHWDSPRDANMECACPTPRQASGRARLPSTNLRPYNCMNSCGVQRREAKARPCRERPTCRKIAIPRRQIASACPNEYITPKPHNCMRSTLCPARSSERLRTRPRHTEPSCSRRRQPTLTHYEDPTAYCPKCCAVPCPYPSSLYFK